LLVGEAALGGLDLLALAGFNLSVADVDGRIAGHLPPSRASAPIPEITFTDICPWLGLVFTVVGLLFRFTIGVIKSKVSIWSGFTVRYKVKVPILQLHCESKKQDTYLLPITSPNIDRFSKFFYC